jgi:hypothetical protein
MFVGSVSEDNSNSFRLGIQLLHTRHQPNCVRLVAPGASRQAKFEDLCYSHMVMYQEISRPSLAAHARCTRDLVHRHLAASTRVRLHRLPVAQALPQHRRAPRLLVIRPHGFYLNTAVHREYSSSCRSGSTSTTPYAAATSSSGHTTTSTTYLD